MPKRLAVIDTPGCVACGVCENACIFGAARVHHGCYAVVDADCCAGCGRCARLCPAGSIEIKARIVV